MTTTKAKTSTPQGISALLRKAGFDKSETRASAIKGWHEWSAGYKVRRGWNDSSVRVEYRRSSLRSRSGGREEELAKWLAAYTEVIAKAGYNVWADSDDTLTVAASPETVPSGAEENHHA